MSTEQRDGINYKYYYKFKILWFNQPENKINRVVIITENRENSVETEHNMTHW